jgi:hypothetical protein
MNCLALFALAAPLLAPTVQDKLLTPATAREAILELNRVWGKARVEYDPVTLEKYLADDFYVKIGEDKITRSEFLEQITHKPKSGGLKRFDVDVLTVQRRGDHWSAVIAEKLEFERQLPDGKITRESSLWVTRDGWKQDDKGNWRVLYSEAVGFEFWREGDRPALRIW